VLIDSNSFVGNADSGLGFSSTDATKPATEITVSNNLFDGNGRALFAFSLTNSSIVSNTMQNATGSATADIRLFEGVNGLLISGNDLQNGAGRALRINNIGTGLADATNVTFTLNGIVGYAGQNIQLDAGSYTGTFDASFNWFGATDLATIASKITAPDGNVDFTPYLNNDESLAEQSVIGFAADLSSVTVHTQGAQTGTTGRIQEAVDAASAGNTINVAAGTYPELVNVNKTVTLLGAQAGVDARTRTGVPESIVNGTVLNAPFRTTAFNITASGATVDGFTVRDQSDNNVFNAGIVMANTTSGVTVRNNIITNNVIGIFAGSSGASLIERNLFDGNNTPGPAGGAGI
jgi:nitrous oxidase accessory protein NosD